MPTGNSAEILRQQILVGIILVGRLGVTTCGRSHDRRDYPADPATDATTRHVCYDGTLTTYELRMVRVHMTYIIIMM